MIGRERVKREIYFSTPERSKDRSLRQLLQGTPKAAAVALQVEQVIHRRVLQQHDGLGIADLTPMEGCQRFIE